MKQMTILASIVAVAPGAAAILSSLVVLSPQASAQNNPCGHTGKNNPNCIQKRLCNDPTNPACFIFEPGTRGSK
ncbi:MAG TPA: hypothetical protein VJ729_06915 [Nitrososphaeraceae archaeon]|nr:hypothetical protein [Nitrososphaeraceae archaeon]